MKSPYLLRYSANSINTERYVNGCRRIGVRIIVLAILLSAFGPYVSKSLGLRVDHIVVYVLCIWAGLRAISKPEVIRFPTTLWIAIACLSVATLWTLVVSIFLRTATPTQILAGVDNYLQPVGVLIAMTIGVSTVSFSERSRLLRMACLTVCLLLFVNAMLAFSAVFWDTARLLRPFVPATTATGEAVMHRATAIGRYTGIFNQPVEAGLAYSTGLAAWLYWLDVARRPTIKHVIVLVVLMVGGALTVSKVFLLGGIPLFVIALSFTISMNRNSVLPYGLLILGFIMFSIPFLEGLRYQWTGWNYILRFTDVTNLTEQGIVEVFTAGRIGPGDTGVEQLFMSTLLESPVYGFGFGIDTALDNGYLEFFYQGGMIALSLYIVLLSAVFLQAIALYRKDPSKGRFLIVLWILVVGAGIGAPTLTLNRSSILIWVLLILAISTATGLKKSGKTIKLPVGRVR